jgi:hypothetical protein
MRGEEAEDALKNNDITQVENINRAQQPKATR